MASIFKDFGCLSRVIFVVNTIGNVFLSLYDFTSVVKRFDYGNEASDDSTINEETTSFRTQTTSLVQLCPGLLETPMAQFKKFHDFTVSCGRPLATVLVTHRLACRKCGNPLTVLEKKVHAVVIYHSERGTYLGSRVTKFCRKCKVYEHYGFWTEDGIKHVDTTCLENEFLLSSEDTAFHMSLIRQCASLLVVGAVPFSTFASSYNQRFGYIKERVATEVDSSTGGKVTKRMKR